MSTSMESCVEVPEASLWLGLDYCPISVSGLVFEIHLIQGTGLLV